MIKIYNKALNKSISINRHIGKIQGKQPGPTIVFFGGIHGNETAGVFALQNAFNKIKKESVKGTIYGISGNLKALKINQRYIHNDLNRLWLNGNLESLYLNDELSNEEEEQKEIYHLLKEIIKDNEGPFYFIDLHTTSSRTLPFITINDALINRKFSKLFPVPIVLGIEEYLDGPLLSYINQLGYVSLGFESGQHDELSAVSNSEAFIFLSLVYSGVLEKDQVNEFQNYYNTLKQEAENISKIFEVVHLHKISGNEGFKMKPNFKSFQDVSKGELLATSNKELIRSTYNAKVFMPLYQTKGKEGFFIIKAIHPFFLKLSEFIRNIRLDNLLVIFPGVSWKNRKKGILKVNLRVARFMVKPIFHLLGYRNKEVNEKDIYLFNRERTSKKKMYKRLKWYQQSH